MLLFIFGFSLCCMTFLSLSLQNSLWSLCVCKSESNCKEMSALRLSSCFVLFFASWWARGFRDPFRVVVPEPEMDLLTSVFSLCCNVCYQKQQGKPLFLKLRVSLETKGTYFLVCVSVELLKVLSFYTEWYQCGDLWAIYQYWRLSCLDVWDAQPESTWPVTALIVQFSTCVWGHHEVRGFCYDLCTGAGNESPFSMLGQGVVLWRWEACPWDLRWLRSIWGCGALTYVWVGATRGDFVLVQDGLVPMLSGPGKHILELGASWWGVQAFWNPRWLILCINPAMSCPAFWPNTSLNTGCEGIF